MRRWLAGLCAIAIVCAAHGGALRAQPAGGGGGGAGDDLPPMLKNPRLVSGQARPEQGDPKGRLTIRTAQGEMHRSEFGDVVGEFPEGAAIHLVAIDRLGHVSLQTAKPDDGGRVVFDHLATDGSVSYWALAIFPRDGAEDRLVSRHPEGRQLSLGPVNLLPEVGMRMMLAGLGRTSGSPPVDDLLDDATTPPPPGEVVIDLDGDTDAVGDVELLEVGVEKPVAVTHAQPAKTVVQPQGRIRDPQSDPALKDGLVEVRVERKGDPVPDIAIEIVPADKATEKIPEGGTAWNGTTDATGHALFDALPAGQKVVLRATVQGRIMVSKPFTPAAKGGIRLTLSVDWLEVDSLRARFTGVAGGADKVYIARAPAKDRVHLSSPFQLTAARGAKAQILIFSGVAMSFHGGGLVDDQVLWFQVQFTLFNPSVIPFDPGPGGLRIPLPKGFVGAGVADEMTARVKVDEDVGFIWHGPVAPGQRDFMAGFNMPIDDGAVAFSMPLPNGTFESQLVVEDLPGIRIDAPGLERETGKGQDGRSLIVFGDIARRPGETIELRIAGLPQPAAWKKWSRRAVAVVVFGLFAWFIVAMVSRARRGGDRTSELEAEREELLQTLVQLEADHRRKKVGDQIYQKGKADLTRKLEAIYVELGAPVAPAGGEGGAGDGEGNGDGEDAATDGAPP